MSEKQSGFERVYSLFRLSLGELVIGLFIIAVLFTAAAFSAYLQDFPLLAELRSLYGSIAENVGLALDNQLVTNLVSFFFWALVGLALYSLLWSLFVIFMDVRNDIVISEYFLHPRSFHKSNYWLAALSRRVIILTALAVIGLYIVLLIRSLPIVYDSISHIFASSFSDLPLSSLYGLLSFMSWLLGWHLIVVVRRVSISLTKEV